VEELKMQLEETENRKNPVDDQLELMERSFQMASRYLPEMMGTTAAASPFTNAADLPDTSESGHVSENTAFMPVENVREQAVTVLLGGLTVSSVETNGTVLPVNVTVYDLDGQSGIFISNMQELNAAKEIVANMGTNAGTSINLSNDAEKQFIADMGRNVIQGVSQFTAKKLREVKVHLKAGYRVYLIPEGSLKTTNQPNMASQ
jgi:hypothetical protein